MNTERINSELLEILKLVKQVMDSNDYSIDFDKLYDLIDVTISKYDNAQMLQ